MITVISRKKERRRGGKAIENYAIEPRGRLSWFCWPKLAQTLPCGSSVWKCAAQNLVMVNVILIVLSSAQPSPPISLHHISPSRMKCPWSGAYTGSSFAHVLPVCGVQPMGVSGRQFCMCAGAGRRWHGSSRRFGGGESHGSSLDISEITCDRCFLEFLPKIWLTVI